MSVITNQLDCLSEVLEDFCTKYNLEFMSADDILYSHQYAEIDCLTPYQIDWLTNYISIWDTIANLWGLIIMFRSKSFGRLFWVDDNLDFKSCPQNVDGTGDFTCEDYVSEWTDWEGVDFDLLFSIHATCLSLKDDYANSLTLEGI